jgi:hypothetical protein
MFKTMPSIVFICMLTLPFFIFPSLASTDQYYLHYPGIGFQPGDETQAHYKNPTGYLYHNDTNDEYYFCPVNFNVPEGSAYYIKSIGMRYLDDLPDGHLEVLLRRRNLYTGAYHTVAEWQSSHTGTSALYLTASKATIAGYKLIDTKKFSYWLYVFFVRDGATIPGPDMAIYQVRVHYGT